MSTIERTPQAIDDDGVWLTNRLDGGVGEVSNSGMERYGCVRVEELSKQMLLFERVRCDW